MQIRMGVGISDKSRIAVSVMPASNLVLRVDSAKNTAGHTICPMALIPWPITRKNPNLSKALLPALFSSIVFLLMKQTVIIRRSSVRIMGKVDRLKYGIK